MGIENATEIFRAAKHPKSFVSLDKAYHLLTDPEDAAFAARVVSVWLTRYLAADVSQGMAAAIEHVRVTETGEGKFQNAAQAGKHRLFADEPESVGGLDTGPSPYDFLPIALGACTSMTLRLYAEHKNLTLGRISVDISHAKMHAKDCQECIQSACSDGAKVDCFERAIFVNGDVSEELHGKIAEIADKCRVHRTFEAVARITTVVRLET